MNENQYIKKIARIIIEVNNKNHKSFKPSKISKKYEDPFEIEEFNIINNALFLMEKEGFVTLKYASKSSSEITKILIIEDKIVSLAKKYSLVTKSDMDKKILNILLSYKDSPYSEICNFIKEELQSFSLNKSIRFAQGQKPETLREVLMGANAILSQKYDISLRELSILIYNDSKILENRLAQILTIINNENIDKNIFLEQHHIFRNKTYVLLKGNAVIYFNNGDRISLTSDNNGSIQLSSEMVKNINKVDTKSILSIENLTSFESYQTNKYDGIILYLGGFSNNVNIDFIKKTTCPISHFGDIDANGFKILNDLKERTGKIISSYKMDIETIIKYSKFGKDMSNYNIKALKQMLSSEEYSSDEKQCFRKLLELNITIEQEIVKKDD